MAEKVRGASANHVILSDGTEVPLKSQLEMPEGTDITYGIRPQHTALVENGISGEVFVVEPTGEDQNLVVHISGQDITDVAHGPQVFIEDYRPGTLEKMGLSVEKLHEVNPD